MVRARPGCVSVTRLRGGRLAGLLDWTDRADRADQLTARQGGLECGVWPACRHVPWCLPGATHSWRRHVVCAARRGGRLRGGPAGWWAEPTLQWQATLTEPGQQTALSFAAADDARLPVSRSLYNNIVTPSKLVHGTDFHLFKARERGLAVGGGRRRPYSKDWSLCADSPMSVWPTRSAGGH